MTVDGCYLNVLVRFFGGFLLVFELFEASLSHFPLGDSKNDTEILYKQFAIEANFLRNEGTTIRNRHLEKNESQFDAFCRKSSDIRIFT